MKKGGEPLKLFRKPSQKAGVGYGVFLVFSRDISVI
jgi:hypothetical protein